MKFRNRIIAFTFTLTIVLYLQSTYSEPPSQHLDVDTYRKKVCSASQLAGVTVTSSQRSSASDILTTLSSSALNQDVAVSLNKQSIDMGSMINDLLPAFVPWAFFLVLSLFGWMFYCCYCCCDKKCPLCCKRNYEENKLRKKELLIPVIIAVVLNLLIFAVSIAGLAYSGDVSSSLGSSECSFMGLFHDILYPSTDGTFPGVYGIGNQTNAIVKDLNSFQASMSSTFNSKYSTTLVTQKNQIITANNNLKRGQSGSPIPEMATSNGASATSGESYLSTQFLFDYILSSSSDSNFATISSAFKALSSNYLSQLNATPQVDVLNSYYDGLINIAASLETNSQPIQQANFGATLQQGVAQTTSQATNIESAATTMYDLIDPIASKSDLITTALYALFGAMLGFSVLALISILVLQFLKLYSIRFLLNIVWAFYCLIMILGFLLGAVMNPSSLVISASCNYLINYANNQTFYAQSTLISDTNTKQIIQTCFYGDGNLFSQFNLTTSTNQLQALTNQTTAFTTIYTNNQQNILTVTSKLTNNVKALSNAKDGTVLDLSPTNYASFQTTISQFNAITGTGCVEIQANTCGGSGNGAAGPATTSNSTTVTTCWAPSYLVTQSGSCSGQSALFATIKQYYQAQSGTWASSLTAENSIYSQHQSLNTNFQSYMTKINSFVGTSNTIITNINTLLGGINCKYLKTSYSNITDSLCVLFLPAIYRTTVLIILASMAMFFASLANWCVSIRYYRVMKYGGADEDFNNKVADKKDHSVDDPEAVPIAKQ